jgi:phage terminase large subunit GpA-like protein
MKVAVGKHSQETRDKISKTRLERKIRHTQETKDLLSRLKKGKQPWL